jgi:hypothetical protein
MRAAAAWADKPGLRNAFYLLLLFVLIMVPILISELLYSTLD